MTESYTYDQRQGIRLISWNDFHGICKALVQAVAPFQPEVILAVGRGGYYAGTLISHILQTDIYPVRLSRRVNDVVVHQSPQWLVRPPSLIVGKRVLIVDEICDTGETLQVVKQEVQAQGAAEVRSAVMYAHTPHSDIPDYIGIITDELLLNPWDREIYRDGVFQFHPEYVGALNEQGITPDESVFIPATPFKVAKG
jgi:hypoxanthine phosphoribosyltransferase